MASSGCGSVGSAIIPSSRCLDRWSMYQSCQSVIQRKRIDYDLGFKYQVGGWENTMRGLASLGISRNQNSTLPLPQKFDSRWWIRNPISGTNTGLLFCLLLSCQRSIRRSQIDLSWKLLSTSGGTNKEYRRQQWLNINHSCFFAAVTIYLSSKQMADSEVACSWTAFKERGEDTILSGRQLEKYLF